MDIIHALGGKIVGRPDTKLTLPDELKKAQVIGNAHQPNFEQIASLKPDVLVATMDSKRMCQRLKDKERKLSFLLRILYKIFKKY